MGPAVFLKREIATAARTPIAQRRIVIAAGSMDRKGNGGLELAVSRAPTAASPPACKPHCASKAMNHW